MSFGPGFGEVTATVTRGHLDKTSVTSLSVHIQPIGEKLLSTVAGKFPSASYVAFYYGTWPLDEEDAEIVIQVNDTFTIDSKKYKVLEVKVWDNVAINYVRFLLDGGS